jgi:hypothetical protein
VIYLLALKTSSIETSVTKDQSKRLCGIHCAGFSKSYALICCRTVRVALELNVLQQERCRNVAGTWQGLQVLRDPPPCRHSNKATRYALPTAMTTAFNANARKASNEQTNLNMIICIQWWSFLSFARSLWTRFGCFHCFAVVNPGLVSKRRVPG